MASSWPSWRRPRRTCCSSAAGWATTKAASRWSPGSGTTRVIPLRPVVGGPAARADRRLRSGERAGPLGPRLVAGLIACLAVLVAADAATSAGRDEGRPVGRLGCVRVLLLGAPDGEKLNGELVGSTAGARLGRPGAPGRPVGSRTARRGPLASRPGRRRRGGALKQSFVDGLVFGLSLRPAPAFGATVPRGAARRRSRCSSRERCSPWARRGRLGGLARTLGDLGYAPIRLPSRRLRRPLVLVGDRPVASAGGSDHSRSSAGWG